MYIPKLYLFIILSQGQNSSYTGSRKLNIL